MTPEVLKRQALGREAYEAYWRVLAPRALPWSRLSADERRAWQAAARAAIRLWDSDVARLTRRLAAGRD